MGRLTYMHKENVHLGSGEVVHTLELGNWLTGLDRYAICENACPLYDVDAEGEPDCSGECPLRIAFDKLAAYEETGLAPEEVAALAKVKDEGRLVELPCKVGDTVYEITQGYCDDEDCPDEYHDYVDDVYVDEISYHVFDTGEIEIKLNDYLHLEDAFLTREAAEAAQKAKEGDK